MIVMKLDFYYGLKITKIYLDKGGNVFYKTLTPLKTFFKRRILIWIIVKLGIITYENVLLKYLYNL